MSLSADRVHARLAASAQLANKGRYAEAQVIITDVLRDDAQNIEALSGLAGLLLAQGETEKAKTLYGDILAAAPDRPDVLASLAQVHRLAGDLEPALICMQRAADLAPHNAMIQAGLAELLLANRQAEAAHAAITRALSLRPSDFAIAMIAGMIAVERRSWDEAEVHFGNAHAEKPEAPEALHNLAELAVRRGEIDLALDFAERAYLKDPSDLVYLLPYARRLMEAGQLQRAETLLARAAATQPSHVELHGLLAHCQIHSGDPARVIATFAALVRRKPSPDGHVMLGKLLRHVGRLREALLLLDEARSHDETNTELYLDTLDLAMTVADRAVVQKLCRVVPDRFTACHVDETELRLFGPGPLLILARQWRTEPERPGLPIYADPAVAGLLALIDGLTVRPLVHKPEESVPLSATLPFLYADTPAAMSTEPCISAQATLQPLWHAALADYPKPWIGLMWNPAVQPVALPALLPMLDGDGTLVSLAVGPEREDLASFGAVLDAGAHISGPADMAAAIATLDLVISVDALAAYLAGALGIPGVVLAERTGQWMWAEQDGRSVWFPSLHVVRFGLGVTPEALHQAVRAHVRAIAPPLRH